MVEIVLFATATGLDAGFKVWIHKQSLARMSIASAIIFGSVFLKMGRSQTSTQDRMGLLQVAATNTAMAALTQTVGVFPKERAIAERERAKGSYVPGP